MPSRRQHTASSSPLLQRLGDYAVWPGLYATACLLLLGWLTGTIDSTPGHSIGLACLFAFLCGNAAYLLDRVKISPSRLDPADLAAQPDRFTNLERRQRAVRVVIVCEIALAAAVGWRLRPLLAALPAGVAAGVWLYAGRPAERERPRPKDWPVAKGLLVAAAHTALAGATLLALDPGLLSVSIHFAEAAVILAALVLADAIVCDMDDLAADRAFGTRSVPVQIGQGRAWLVAGAAYVACGAAALLLRPFGEAALLAALLAGSGAIALALPTRRDFIDARLIVIAGLCLWLA